MNLAQYLMSGPIIAPPPPVRNTRRHRLETKEYRDRVLEIIKIQGSVSTRNLAREMEVSVGTVTNWLEFLNGEGQIVKETRKGSVTGSGGRTSYWSLPDAT
jgi:Mn-dependent DtxR family transcriptional regulator